MGAVLGMGEFVSKLFSLSYVTFEINTIKTKQEGEDPHRHITGDILQLILNITTAARPPRVI